MSLEDGLQLLTAAVFLGGMVTYLVIKVRGWREADERRGRR